MGFFETITKGVNAAKDITSSVQKIADLVNPPPVSILIPGGPGPQGPPAPATSLVPMLAIGAAVFLLTRK